MYKKLIFNLFILLSTKGFSQYSFKGQIADKATNNTIYLSIIEDYMNLGRISMEQILKKTTTDSLGNLNFEGKNLVNENRIYRIHLDEGP